MTPEERARTKALWKQRGDAIAAEREADRKSFFGDTGLFGVNGPISRGLGTAIEYSRLPAIIRGVNRSTVGSLQRSAADLIGLENKADERALFRDEYISDRTLRPGSGDVLDRFLTVGAKWTPDILLLRGMAKPALAVAKAPLTAPAVLKGAFAAHPIASTVNTGIIGNLLNEAWNDAKYVATGNDTYAQDIEDKQLKEQEEQLQEYKNAVSEQTLSNIYKAQDLTPAEKDRLIQMQTSIDAGADDAAARHAKAFEQMYTARKVKETTPADALKETPKEIPVQNPAPTKTPVKKPFDWRDYKGELGFGALGGATGYGLGHMLKWGMPAKLLSALTGAALGAYGYNRLKG